MAKVSERLKKALELRNMKSSVLSQLTGISESAISRYLSEYYEPKTKRIKLMAEALDVSEGWLSGDDVSMSREKRSPLESELLQEYVIYHRDGRNVKVKFNEQQMKIFEALVESAHFEDADA